MLARNIKNQQLLWKTLEQADMLPKDLRASIEKQIMAVATTVK